MKRTSGPSAKRSPSTRRPAASMDAALREYIAKTDRYRAGRDPVKLLEAGPARIARAVRGLTRQQLQRRPARGKWSILEILGHLHDTEVVYGYRWRLMAAQPGAPILGYDQELWARELKHRRADANRILGEIAALRRATLGVIRRIPRREWPRRYGRHTERGRETLLRSMELIAGHDLNHLDQIRAIRARFGW